MAKVSTTPWIAWYWSDWIADTTHLGHSEKGIYMALLELYYQHGKPLTHDLDKLFYTIRVTAPEDQKAAKSILEEYFVPGILQLEGGDTAMVWRHNRCDRALHEARERFDAAKIKAKNAANARWAKGANIAPSNAPSNSQAKKSTSSNAPSNSQAMLSISTTTATTTSTATDTATTTKTLEQSNGTFARFWGAYPTKRNKGHAEKAWNKLKPNEQLTSHILDALAIAKTSVQWKTEGGRYIPHPATWLNARGWEDEIAPIQPQERKLVL